MADLYQCYQLVKDIVGSTVEPFDVVAAVDAYRQYWKPENVKVVLLAESHVYTTMVELTHQLDVPDASLSLPDYPHDYVRFVYCLGYGENDVMSKPVPRNGGTPQYWKVFYSCLYPITSHTDFTPILKVTPFKDRIKNKVDLLHSLRERGVWLVDASIVALYRQGVKPSPVQYKEIVERCWDNYIGATIREAQPQHIICIGNGVRRTLESRLSALNEQQIHKTHQPQAHVPTPEHMASFQQYYDICTQRAE